jgi:AraC-like DNA-binding protein
LVYAALFAHISEFDSSDLTLCWDGVLRVRYEDTIDDPSATVVREEFLTAADMTRFRISTRAFSPKDRTEAFRETWGRTMFQLDMEPLAREEQLDVDLTLSVFPTLRFAEGHVSRVRSRHLGNWAADDDLIFTVLRSGAASWDWRGLEANVGAGEAILTANGETTTYVGHTPVQLLNFRFNRQKLSARLSHVETSLVRTVPNDNKALWLLKNYVGVLGDEQVIATPSLRLAVDDHLHDLLALALGATRDAGELARRRGVRFARLRAIQAEIAANLTRRDLSVDVLAARHGVSPRYIRGLFQDVGTTFTDFVLHQRLARAHLLLTGPHAVGRSISAIAYDAGFGDLSHFNHAFRRRYGATPSEIRASAPKDDAAL